MNRRSLIRTLLGTAAVLPYASSLASAQTFSKPIRLVVPFSAGSSTDIVARIIARPLAEALGQSVTVDNKPGADGAIAAMDVKKATPDGTTLFVATNSPMSAAPALQKNIQYDALKDFTSIAHIGNYSFFVLVHPDMPVKTFSELIAYAKANPDKLNYGTGSTSSIVYTGTITRLAGITMTHVPYKSEPPAVLDLVAGRLQVMVASYTTVAGQIKEGKLRVLLTVLPQRSPLLPDVPAISETALPPFGISSFCALYGPAGMAPDLVLRINKEVVAILARPEIRDLLNQQAFPPKGSTPDELVEITRMQFATWGDAVRKAGLGAE